MGQHSELDPTAMADGPMSPPEAPAGTPPPVPSGPAPASGSPNEFLKAVVGKRVVVRLLSGVDYKGEGCIDCVINCF
jgi:U6 snRNA-associated Sm-like protein LSm6